MAKMDRRTRRTVVVANACVLLLLAVAGTFAWQSGYRPVGFDRNVSQWWVLDVIAAMVVVTAIVLMNRSLVGKAPKAAATANRWIAGAALAVVVGVVGLVALVWLSYLIVTSFPLI